MFQGSWRWISTEYSFATGHSSVALYRLVVPKLKPVEGEGAGQFRRAVGERVGAGDQVAEVAVGGDEPDGRHLHAGVHRQGGQWGRVVPVGVPVPAERDFATAEERGPVVQVAEPLLHRVRVLEPHRVLAFEVVQVVGVVQFAVIRAGHGLGRSGTPAGGREAVVSHLP